MDTLWGVTDTQFLLAYAGLMHVVIGIRVLIPGRGADARVFDLPNLLFLLALTTGLIRLAHTYFAGREVRLLVVVLVGVAIVWFLSNYNRLLMLERKRFWLALLFAASVTAIEGLELWSGSAETRFSLMAFSNGMLFWVLLGDGSGSGGSGDGDGGGGE